MKLGFALCALKSLRSVMTAKEFKMLHVPFTVMDNVMDGCIATVKDNNHWKLLKVDSAFSEAVSTKNEP